MHCATQEEPHCLPLRACRNPASLVGICAARLVPGLVKPHPRGKTRAQGSRISRANERDQIMATKTTQKNASNTMHRSSQPPRQAITLELVAAHTPSPALVGRLCSTFGLAPVDYDGIREATKDQIEEAKDMAGEDHVKFLQEKMHIEQIALLEAQRLGDKKEAHELERQMHKDKVEMGKVLEDQAKKQRALDEEIKLSKQGLREAEIGSAMPTLKEISGSKDWSSIMVDHYRSQRERDRENPAYLKQFARQAQELELLEEDKAGALRSEGPQSARFKADVSRIRSLQKELSDAGLQKGSPLEKMEEHLRKLYEKAEGEGLIVQAVNAP